MQNVSGKGVFQVIGINWFTLFTCVTHFQHVVTETFMLAPARVNDDDFAVWHGMLVDKT